jgi:hypothetical protein
MKGGLLQLIFVVGSLVFLMGIWLVLRGPDKIDLDGESKGGPAAGSGEGRRSGSGDEPPGAGPRKPKQAA